MKKIAIATLCLAQLDGLIIRYLNLSLGECLTFLGLLILSLSIFGVTATSLFNSKPDNE